MSIGVDLPKKSDKEIIIEWLTFVNVKGMFGLLDYMENNGFFVAPCSAGHHLNVNGGLAKHSLSVLLYALHLYHKYDLPIPMHSIIKCALLHDIHKMFLYEKKRGKWQYKNENKGKIFKSNPINKLHGDWAVRIIYPFIKLTDLEKEMILWHMGPFTEYYDYHKPGDFFKWSNDKKNPNVNASLFLYFCDHFSSMFLED